MLAWRFLLIISLILYVISGPVIGQQGRDQIKQIEILRDKATAEQQQLELQAKNIQKEIRKLQQKLIEVGSSIAEQNQRSVEVEEHLLSLQEREQRQRADLRTDQQVMSEVMAALQRSEMSPPPPLAVSPGDTLAAARASMLMGATVPELRKRADALRASLVALQLLRKEITSGRADLDQQIQVLANKREGLQILLDKRRSLEIRLRSDAKEASKRAKLQAKNAVNLRELIRQLELEASKSVPSIKPDAPVSPMALAPRLKPRFKEQSSLTSMWKPPTGRFSDSRGQIEFPVHAEVANKYGSSNNPDTVNGLVFRTSRRAQIVAPYDAIIAYAGTFRNFGQLLILDVGEGYHMIMAGLSVSYVVKGQTVLAGEPIGKMADRRKPAPEFYLEFRNQGRPFDPEPWLKKAINAG